MNAAHTGLAVMTTFVSTYMSTVSGMASSLLTLSSYDKSLIFPVGDSGAVQFRCKSLTVATTKLDVVVTLMTKDIAAACSIRLGRGIARVMQHRETADPPTCCTFE